MGGHVCRGCQFIKILLNGGSGSDDGSILLYIRLFQLALHDAPKTAHRVIPRQTSLLGVLAANLEILLPGGGISAKHLCNLSSVSRQSCLLEQIRSIANSCRTDVVAGTNSPAIAGLGSLNLPVQPIILLQILTQIHELVRHG